jgi:hypothetical protein
MLGMKNTETTHLYRNIMHCTVSCWTLGEHGDREQVSNGGEEVYDKSTIFTDTKHPGETPWDCQ